MIAHESHVSFNAEELGVLRSALGEVTLGFEVSDFERTIGMHTADVRSLFLRLRSLGPTTQGNLTPVEVRAARNSLRETIRELGEEEFQTRTGYDFNRGKAVLESLDRLSQT